jgi:hypothetical protein
VRTSTFQHLVGVDVPFDGAGAPPQAEAVGGGVLVGAQPGDEGAQGGLAGGPCVGYPGLEKHAAAALVREVAKAGRWQADRIGARDPTAVRESLRRTNGPVR